MSASESSFARTLKPYVCGGTAATFASVCLTRQIHPIDITKVRLQLVNEGGKGGSQNALSVARAIIRADGVTGLYAGLSAAMTRQITYGTARLGLHRTFSNMLIERNGGGPLPLYLKFSASFASGSLGAVIGNPFDVSLVRMQSDGLKPEAERRGYKNVFDAIGRIIREEGAASLWRGFTPTLCRAVAMNVGMMTSYDQAKEFYTGFMGTGMQTNIVSSATAGVVCAVMSLPFDMIKTRLQNMKALPSGELPYKGVIDCGVKVVKNEGVFGGLYKGFLPYWGRCAPHSIIILLSIEGLSSAYERYLL